MDCPKCPGVASMQGLGPMRGDQYWRCMDCGLQFKTDINDDVVWRGDQ